MKYFIYTIVALAAGLRSVAQQQVLLTPQQQVALWLKEQKAAPSGESALPLFQTLTPSAFASLRTAGCGTSFCPVNSPLPVKEIRLEGERSSRNQVQLTFTTIGELDTKGYRIERAYNTQPALFDSVAYRVSLNNDIKSEYKLADANSFQEMSYYRVLQIDNNGQFRYSNTIAVKGYKSGVAVSIIPNPGHSVLTTFSVAGVTNEWVAIRVTNSVGVALYSARQFVQNSTLLTNNNLPVLPAGVYYVTATTTTKSASAKWIVIN